MGVAMRRLAGILALVVPSVFLVAPPARAATQLTAFCGIVLNASGTYVLRNNVEQCAGPAIKIADDDITLDLNGHRLAGTGSGTGIENNTYKRRVVVRNGTIAAFGTGIITSGISNTIEGLNLIDNTTYGVHVAQGERTLLRGTVGDRNGVGIQIDDSLVSEGSFSVRATGNVVTRSDTDGIVIDTSSHVTLSGNRSIGNGDSGLYANASEFLTIADNNLSMNDIDGALLNDVDDSKMAQNRTIGNGVIGIRNYTGSEANVITGNRASANGQDGIFVSTGNQMLQQNTTLGNVGYGININGGGGHRLIENSANENGAEGIFSAVSAVLKRNVANGNSFLNGSVNNAGLGIDAPAGSGSGNIAAHNDADAQCLIISGCTAGSVTPPKNLFGCGADVTRSLRLANSLTGCGVLGLRIAKAGITVDFGGHRIAGTNASNSAGISNKDGLPNVTLLNAVVSTFYADVWIGGGTSKAAGSVVRGMYLSDQNGLSPAALRIQDGTRVTATGNLMTGQGILAMQSSYIHLTGNTAIGAGGGTNGQTVNHFVASNNRSFGVTSPFGVGFSSSDSALLSNFARASVSGAGVVQSQNVRVAGNVISGTGSGLQIAGSGKVTVEGNTFQGCDQTAIDVDSSAPVLIRGNVARACDDDGIWVHGIGASARVIQNAAHENGVDGIHAEGTLGPTAVRMDDNVANLNGFIANPAIQAADDGLGLEGPTGTPGSGNTAHGNDNPLECFPASLCA
jgi:parallel beta-helix repeat protein